MTWTSVPVVIEVRVSSTSAVAEMREGVSSDSDWESVEPQSFSFSRKRSIFSVENQQDMSYAGTPVKAPPTSGRRMSPPTPQQSSYSSIEAVQWQIEVEDSEDLKVSTRELKEQVLFPDESSVSTVRIARQARSDRNKKLFQIFRQGANEVLIASMARWEEHLEGLGAQGGRGAFKRKTRSFGYSDGGQGEHAEGSTRRLSEADLRRVTRAVAKDKGSAGTRTKEALDVKWEGERKRT